jgi:beta-lactam-binding protein with PASTA domain
VPWLEGGTEDFARRKLAQAGFRVDVVYQEVVDPVKDGRILAQIYDAKEGGQAELDSVVTLVIGRRQ